MAKTVFRYGEIKAKDGKFALGLTKSFEPVVEEVEEEKVEEYTGPTVEELKAQAEAFKAQWEEEKAKLIASAQGEADNIIKEAKESAFAEVKKQTDEAATIKSEAKASADAMIKEAQESTKKLLDEAKERRDEDYAKLKESALADGRKAGYDEGKLESKRLIERLHLILGSIIAKRQAILDESEAQIVELVLLMARKVVKVISESQRSVVMSNVVEALRKVKGQSSVSVRVNMEEAQLCTEHMQDFLNEVESIKELHIMEDSSIDKGGCIVETDFGQVDARIARQLAELEQKILEVSPIKSSSKPIDEGI